MKKIGLFLSAITFCLSVSFGQTIGETQELLGYRQVIIKKTRISVGRGPECVKGVGICIDREIIYEETDNLKASSNGVICELIASEKGALALKIEKSAFDKKVMESKEFTDNKFFVEKDLKLDPKLVSALYPTSKNPAGAFIKKGQYAFKVGKNHIYVVGLLNL